MLYHHTDAQRQLIREHQEQLAQEVRRARGPAQVASSPRGTRLGISLRATIRRLSLEKTRFAPARNV